MTNPRSEEDSEDREFLRALSDRHRQRSGSSPCPEPRVLLASHEGVLPEEQAQEVESHVKTCRICQLLRRSFEEAELPGVSERELDRVYARIKGKLDVGSVQTRPRSGWSWWTLRLAPVAAVLVVAAGSVWLFRTLAKKPELVVATPAPPTPSGQTVDLASLVPMEVPPVEIPIEALLDRRASGTDSKAVYFRKLAESLAPYRNQDYRRSETALATVIEAYPDAPEAHFYEGICFILIDRPGEAIRHLGKENVFAGTRWERRAQWYLGVGKLRAGDAPGALGVFRRLCDKPGEFQEDACAAVQHVSGASGAVRR